MQHPLASNVRTAGRRGPGRPISRRPLIAEPRRALHLRMAHLTPRVVRPTQAGKSIVLHALLLCPEDRAGVRRRGRARRLHALPRGDYLARQRRRRPPLYRQSLVVCISIRAPLQNEGDCVCFAPQEPLKCHAWHAKLATKPQTRNLMTARGVICSVATQAEQ